MHDQKKPFTKLVSYKIIFTRTDDIPNKTPATTRKISEDFFMWKCDSRAVPAIKQKKLTKKFLGKLV